MFRRLSSAFAVALILCVTSVPVLPAGAVPPTATLGYEFAPDAESLSISLSQSEFASGSDAVVIAPSWGFPDQLGVSALCGVANAPLLVTEYNISADVLDEVVRLGASQAYLITLVGNGANVALLQGEGLTVTTVAGDDRYGTAARAAGQAQVISAEPTTTAFLVSGENPYGAGVVGPAAFGQGIPVFATLSTSLPWVTYSAMDTLGIERVIIVGNTTDISDSVAASVANIGSVTELVRIGGSDWLETSRLFAAHAQSAGWVGTDSYGVTEYDDTLGDVLAGVYAGTRAEALLYADSTDGVDGTTLAMLVAAQTAGELDDVTVVAEQGVDPCSGWVALGQIELALTGSDTYAPCVGSDLQDEYDDLASIELRACDGGSGVVSIDWSIDGLATQTVTAPSTLVEYWVPGEHTLTYLARDANGNVSEPVEQTFRIAVTDRYAIEIAGTDRYSTAIEAAEEAYPNGTDTVVIATGLNWPDALGGAALAGVVDGPLLLTTPTELPGNVLSEIRHLGAENAYILGGDQAVSSAVENTLKANLSGTVKRLAGSGRYATAGLIAAEVIRLQGSSYDHKAFIATGVNFPDALGASPLAAANGTPIILVAPDANPSLPSSVDEAVILGAEGAVTTKTEGYVRATLGSANVERVGGSDRYDTAAKIAAMGVEGGMYWDGVGIATGAEFPDAMSGGAMLGSFNSVMLLTPKTVLSSSADKALRGNRDLVRIVTFLGGTSAVSDTVRNQVADALLGEP